MSHSKSLLRSTRANQVIPQAFEQTHKDLMAYNGTFNLLLNLRNAIMRYGRLTDKQWTAAAKCLTPKQQEEPQTLSINCNIPITINANAARVIARNYNWPFNPRTLTVTEIRSADRKGYTAVVKIDWTGDSQDCRCCGKALTDWRSQATGVGPVCVKRTNIKYVTNQADVARFQKDMEALAQKLGEVEVTIKNWAIVQGASQLKAAIPAPVKPTPTVTRPKISITNCTWDPQKSLFTVKGHSVSMDNTEVEVVNSMSGNSRIFTKHLTTPEVTLWKCDGLYLVFDTESR